MINPTTYKGFSKLSERQRVEYVELMKKQAPDLYAELMRNVKDGHEGKITKQQACEGMKKAFADYNKA